jgi:hypothetical protein
MHVPGDPITADVLVSKSRVPDYVLQTTSLSSFETGSAQEPGPPCLARAGAASITIRNDKELAQFLRAGQRRGHAEIDVRSVKVAKSELRLARARWP